MDRYLDGSDDEDIIGSLRDHKLVFSNDKGATDAMARTEKLDDYLVSTLHNVCSGLPLPCLPGIWWKLLSKRLAYIIHYCCTKVRLVMCLMALLSCVHI